MNQNPNQNKIQWGDNQTQRYHQPPPKQKPDPNQRKQLENQNQNNQQNQQKIQPNEPLWLQILKLLSASMNALGEFLISDTFINTLQKVFTEHLEVLNYILKNINSRKFWYSNTKFSLLLTIIFLIKGFFIKTTLTFEVFAVMSVISFLVLKIQNSKGDVLEVTTENSKYIKPRNDKKDTDVSKSEVEVNEASIKEERPAKETPTPKPKQKLAFEEEEGTEEEQDQSKGSIMDKIRNMHEQVQSMQQKEPSAEILNEAVNKMPNESRHNMQFNSLMSQLQQRNVLDEALKPLNQIKEDSRKSKENIYEGLLNNIDK